MKKSIALIVVFSMLLTSAVALTGCSNSKDQAREYMDTADEAMTDIQDSSGEMTDELSKVNSLLSGNTAPTSQAVAEEVNKFESITEPLMEKSEKAKKEYQKMLTLKNQPDYVKYARLRIEYIDSVLEMLENIIGFLKATTGFLALWESGGMTQEQANVKATEISTTYGKKIQEIGKNTEKLRTDAKDLRNKKNL